MTGSPFGKGDEGGFALWCGAVFFNEARQYTGTMAPGESKNLPRPLFSKEG
jgi:hypothetical protein